MEYYFLCHLVSIKAVKSSSDCVVLSPSVKPVEIKSLLEQKSKAFVSISGNDGSLYGYPLAYCSSPPDDSSFRQVFVYLEKHELHACDSVFPAVVPVFRCLDVFTQPHLGQMLQ